MIRALVRDFCKSLVKLEFDVLDSMNARDFVHLYDFQKYFLFMAIRRLTALVKLKKFRSNYDSNKQWKMIR